MREGEALMGHRKVISPHRSHLVLQKSSRWVSHPLPPEGLLSLQHREMNFWPVSAQGFCVAAVAMLPSWEGERSAGGCPWQGVKLPALELLLDAPVLSSRHKLPQLEAVPSFALFTSVMCKGPESDLGNYGGKI